MAENNTVLGWRKLAAWFLIYAFVVAATLIFKHEVQATNAELIKWTTAFFFGANAMEHLFGKLSVNVGPK